MPKEHGSGGVRRPAFPGASFGSPWLGLLLAAALWNPAQANPLLAETEPDHLTACSARDLFFPLPGPQAPSIPSELQSPQTTVTIRADSQEKVKDTFRLRGHVEVTYREMRLTASEATYDQSTGEVVARGSVTFTDPKGHFEAEEARYNLRTDKGWFSNVDGYVHAPAAGRARATLTQNPFYLQATTVERLGDDRYVVNSGRVSSCEDQSRGWSLAVHRARIYVGDKVVTYSDIFRLLRIPLFYAPALVHSIARNPRQTGFLVPSLGNSSQKGTILGEGFFWAIHSSADLLFGVENFSKRGPALSGRFRARPSDSSELYADYFQVDDRGSGPMRENRAAGKSLQATGKAADLGFGFRGVLGVDYVTSLAFRETWSESFTQAVSSEAHQNGFLTNNFDAYSVNLYVSRYQDFLSTAQTPGNSIIIQHTPSISFSGTAKELGNSPFYFAFESSAAGVERDQPGFSAAFSDRLDLHPAVTLRSQPFWGFRLTPTVGARATEYGTSLAPGHGAITRLLGEFSLDLRPPSFEKVFSRPFHNYRFKHVIEPDIQYRLVRARDPQDITDVVRFDEIDTLSQTNEIEYSLTNTILARRDVPDDQAEKPQARDLLSLRLSQNYYFDPTFGGALQPGSNVFEPTLSLTGFAFANGRRLSPIVSVLKFAPFSNFDTELRADYDLHGRGFLDAGLTSRVHRGRFGLAATEFFVSRTEQLPGATPPATTSAGRPSFNLLRTLVTYSEAGHKGLSGGIGVDYNFAQSIANGVVAQGSYNFGCFGLDFGYRRFALGTFRRENQFRVALSLSNVGEFGNLKSRDRLYR